MNLVDLMQCYRNDTIPHYNVWYGEEQALIDVYINKLKTLGYKLVYTDTVADAFSSMVNSKLYKKSKVCYIVTEDSVYIKQEKDWDKVKNAFESSNHTLICRYATLNKRLKFFKNNVPTCFEKMNRDVLFNHVEQMSMLNKSNVSKLVEICDNDYGKILLEYDKIKQASQFRKADENTVFMDLIEQGVITGDIGDITFKFTDAILYGDMNNAPRLLEQEKCRGESPLVACSVLYNGFRNMLILKSFENPKDILTGWQIKHTKDLMGAYNAQEIIRNMNVCDKVEKGIKNGLIDENLALDYLVVNCLK